MVLALPPGISTPSGIVFMAEVFASVAATVGHLMQPQSRPLRMLRRRPKRYRCFPIFLGHQQAMAPRPP